MEFLGLINILMAILLQFYPIWYSKKLLLLPTLNPISILTLVLIPVEVFKIAIGPFFKIDNILLDGGYQFAVLMTNIQIFIAALVTLLIIKGDFGKQAIKILDVDLKYSNSLLYKTGWIFLFIFIISFIVMSTLTGGILEWVMSPREAYGSKRDGFGVLFALCLNSLSVSYLMFCLSLNRFVIFIRFSGLFLFLFYLLGSKGILVRYLVCFLIFVWKLRRDSFHSYLMISGSLVLAVVLINFMSGRESTDFAAVAEYFDYYTNAALYYNDYFNNSIGLFNGEIFLTSFWSYVPRSLFQIKPYVYGILNVVEHFYPGGAESGNTPSFDEGGVPYFADFGILGVIFFAVFNVGVLINALAYYYLFKMNNFYQTNHYRLLNLLLLLLTFAPYFGGYLPSGLLITFVFSILIITYLVKEGNKLIKFTIKQ